MIMMKQLFFLRGNQQYRTTWTHRVKWTNCSVSRLSSHGFLNLLANAILLLPRMGELTTRSLLPWWRITALRLFQIDGACFNGLLHLLWKLSEIFHGLCNCWGEQIPTPSGILSGIYADIPYLDGVALPSCALQYGWLVVLFWCLLVLPSHFTILPCIYP